MKRPPISSSPTAASPTVRCPWLSGAPGCLARTAAAPGDSAVPQERLAGHLGLHRLPLLAFSHARARGTGLRIGPRPHRLRRRPRHQGRCRSGRRLRDPGGSRTQAAGLIARLPDGRLLSARAGGQHRQAGRPRRGHHHEGDRRAGFARDGSDQREKRWRRCGLDGSADRLS